MTDTELVDFIISSYNSPSPLYMPRAVSFGDHYICTVRPNARLTRERLFAAVQALIVMEVKRKLEK